MEPTGTAASGIEVVYLDSRDVVEVHDLHVLCRSQSPYGHLAIRTKEDYRALLSEPENVIATGIRDEGRLVALSVCHRLTANPYDDNPVLAGIDPVTSTAFHGVGTVVHPDYRRRSLAKRLFDLRREQMADRHIEHMFYLAAIDNLGSLVALVPGAMLVGFRRDETAMNYIAYCGCLQADVRADILPVSIDWRDRNRQEELFSERLVVCGLSRLSSPSAAGGERHGFNFLPMA
jgi:hypothetical protein